MLIVIIRDGHELSKKARFVVQLLRLNANSKFIYAYRKEEDRFREKWSGNEIALASSKSAILAYFILMMLKSPKDLHDGIIRRVLRRKAPYLIRTGGFLSVLSQAIYQYFGRSARAGVFISLLKKLSSPKLILISRAINYHSIHIPMILVLL